MPRRPFLALALAWVSCAENPEPKPAVVTLPTSAPVSDSAQPVASAMAGTEAIPANVPLRAGRVRFEGMVRPTKGGFDVRGVTLDHGRLLDALSTGGGARRTEDSVLGALLAIEAELVREADARSDGSLRLQSRGGEHFRVEELAKVEVLAEPATVEGKLERSKGYFSIASHLVSADDLRWSLVELNGNFEGKRVRLWGQPRTEHCAPNAQCLTSGSLPMFDVGRAEVLP